MAMTEYYSAKFPHDHFSSKYQKRNMTNMMKDKMVVVTGSGGGSFLFRSRVVERDVVVLNNGVASIKA